MSFKSLAKVIQDLTLVKHKEIWHNPKGCLQTKATA